MIFGHSEIKYFYNKCILIAITEHMSTLTPQGLVQKYISSTKQFEFFVKKCSCYVIRL